MDFLEVSSFSYLVLTFHLIYKLLLMRSCYTGASSFFVHMDIFLLV